MKILNASRSALSIMMDRGDMLTVHPGKLSPDFVATTNVILGVIKAKKPEEVGIILGGTWEQSIANSISGGQPYYYCSEDEAKAKLLDPTIDYSATMVNNQNEDLKSELKKANETIDSLRELVESKDAQIKELNDKLNDPSQKQFVELKTKELTQAKEQLEVQVKKLTAELEGEKSTNQTLKATTDQLTADKAAKDERIQLLANDNKDLTSKVSELEANNASLIAELDKAKASGADELVKVQDQLNKTKEALEQATNQIESMKATFNGVCDQFGIEYVDGKWIQSPKAE